MPSTCQRCVFVLLTPMLALAEEDQDRFFNWLQEGVDEAGSSHAAPPLKNSLEFRWGQFGKSLFAKRPFRNGEVIAILPISRLVTSRNYGRALPDGFSELAKMALWLLRQRKLGHKSLYEPYMRLLPREHTRPTEWPPELLEAQLVGSGFPEYLRSDNQSKWDEYMRVRAVVGPKLSWKAYDWAINTVTVRSIRYQRHDGQFTTAMWPLYELTLHVDPAVFQSVSSEVNINTDEVKLFAKRDLSAGEEILSRYWSPYQVSNYVSLLTWGFASELTSLEVKRLDLSIEASEAASLAEQFGSGSALPVGRMQFQLNESAEYMQGKEFMGYLRFLVSGLTPDELGVSCGEHEAPDCSFCPQGHGASWCNGDCVWSEDDRDCKDKPDVVRRYMLSEARSNLTTLLRAARAGRKLVRDALSRYPQTLAEDETALHGDIPDVRVRYMIIIRRDEKAILHWWLRFFTLSLAREAGDIGPGCSRD